jgi:hypothetical protein
LRRLLDHCVPRRFGRLLLPNEVQTAAQVGFDALKNGALLRAAAAAGFDAMVTVDQGIAFQQNLTALPIGVILLMAPNNEVATLAPLAPTVVAVAARFTRGSFVRVHLDGRVENL